MKLVLVCAQLVQVSHLENTGSALAEDVIQKSEIIKSYFMANKAGERSHTHTHCSCKTVQKWHSVVCCGLTHPSNLCYKIWVFRIWVAKRQTTHTHTHTPTHTHTHPHTRPLPDPHTHTHTHTHPHTPDHSPAAPSRSVDKLSPMRLVNLVKGNKVEETLAEINRKMQRALEEALMKNIHLHKVSVCGERAL